MKFAALAALSFATCFIAVLHAQTLARPGWAGSGLNVQPWWKHAVIYEIDVRSFQDSDGDKVGDLKGIAQRLDYLKSLGVDAILLDTLAATKPVSVGAKPVDQTSPIDPALGTADDFDDLLREASRRNIRILLSLAEAGPSADSNLLPLARFWLSRGIAGFRLSAASGEMVSSLRRLVSTYAGQRILITDANLAGAAQQSMDGLGGLILDSALLSIREQPPSSSAGVAASIRLAMEQSQAILRNGTPLFATDGAGAARSVDRFGGASHDAGIAKIIGAVLLLDRSASVIYSGQEIGLHSPSGEAVAMPWGTPPPVAASPEVETAAPPPPAPVPAPQAASDRYVPYVAPAAAAKAVPICGRCMKELIPLAADPNTVAGQDTEQHSVLNFYRQLSQLHHGNSALRDGEQIMLNHDDLNALVWVRKPSSVTPLKPAIVIVCNLSDRPLVLPLKAELARLHLRGSFLRTILRSDDAMGSMHLDPITVPPFGVYVGELRY